MDELAVKRVERAKDSRDVSPVDLLLTMAEDIRKGRVKCNRLHIAALFAEETGPWELTTYRANLSHDRELATLELCKRRTLRNWLGDA